MKLGKHKTREVIFFMQQNFPKKYLLNKGKI